MTTFLDTHDGLTLGLERIHPIISSLNRLVIVLYLEQPLFYFRETLSIKDMYAPIFFPLLTKLRAARRPWLVSFTKRFIVGSNTVDL